MSKKTYNDYYQDETFRAKRLEYMAEKVTCECGTVCSRVNLPRHQRTGIHDRRLEKSANIAVIQQNIVEMEKKIDKIQRDIDASKKRIKRAQK